MFFCSFAVLQNHSVTRLFIFLFLIISVFIIHKRLCKLLQKPNIKKKLVELPTHGVFFCNSQSSNFQQNYFLLYIKYILYRRYGICVMCIHTVYVKWKNHIVGIKCSHLDPTLARAALSLIRHCLDQSSVLTSQ